MDLVEASWKGCLAEGGIHPGGIGPGESACQNLIRLPGSAPEAKVVIIQASGFCDQVFAHVLAKDFGYDDTAVSLLIVFQDGCSGPSDGYAGTI